MISTITERKSKTGTRWLTRAIARLLTEEGVPTARGGQWHMSTVRNTIRSVRLDREAAEARGAA